MHNTDNTVHIECYRLPKKGGIVGGLVVAGGGLVVAGGGLVVAGGGLVVAGGGLVVEGGSSSVEKGKMNDIIVYYVLYNEL